jgi:predicted phage-related endonuclease
MKNVIPLPFSVKERTKYLGASEAKHILAGGRAWQDLWKQKTGRVQPDDLSDVFPVQLGSFTEDFHLDWTIARLGRTTDWREIKGGRQHEDRVGFFNQVPMLAHLDALIINEATKGKAPVEVKHSSGQRKLEDLVDFYMPQLQQIMLCGGYEKLLFSAILANTEPERLWIGRSHAYADVLTEQSAAFWKYVTTDTLPPIDGPVTMLSTAAKNAVEINDMIVRDATLDNHFVSAATDYNDNQDAAKKFETAKKDLKSMVADNERDLYCPALTIKRSKSGSLLFSKGK